MTGRSPAGAARTSTPHRMQASATSGVERSANASMLRTLPRGGGPTAGLERLDEQGRDVDHPQLLPARADAVVEHHRAERAGDGQRLRPGLCRLAHALLVDRRAALLHPHMGAARAAAERALAALLHL